MPLNKLTFYLLLFGTLFVLSNSCSERDSETDNGKKPGKDGRKERPKTITRIASPENRASFVVGEKVPLLLEQTDTTQTIDSVRFFVDGEWLATRPAPPYSFEWDTQNAGTGLHTLITVTYKSDSTREGNNVKVELLSDIQPANYRYRVVRQYPHDTKAFTQGLVYEDGFLYEGTGQKGASSLRKSLLTSGEILKMRQLEANYFGEGIALFGDEIFQLTWHSQTGFVYDKNTFELKREFKYPTEGWGLTSNGEYLIMSDGSENLVFLDPQSFGEVYRLQVYNHQGPVKKLNELEYINGEIFANIWEKEEIVRIDAKTGKVTGIINMENLLDRSQVRNQVDVLNGIAFDPMGNRIFVTGKWWPFIYEITLVNAQ